MKKIISMLLVAVALLSSTSVYARMKLYPVYEDQFEVTLYSLDGRTTKVYENQVSDYTKVGWYENRSDVIQKLYSADGDTITVYKAQVPDYLKVGWFTSRQEAEPKQKLYSLDGRAVKVPKSQVKDYLKVGWYENYSDVIQKLYSPNGDTIKVYKAQVADYLSVGWYEDLSDAKQTLYSLDGRTITVFKSEVQSYLQVGWYENYNDTIVTLYHPIYDSIIVYKADVQKYLDAGWSLFPVSNSEGIKTAYKRILENYTAKYENPNGVRYLVYDIDKDGVSELLIDDYSGTNGERTAYVYVYKNGVATQVGEIIPWHSTYLTVPNQNGIMTYWIGGGTQGAYIHSLVNGRIYSELVYEDYFYMEETLPDSIAPGHAGISEYHKNDFTGLEMLD